jgi:hypothetical protein
MNLLEEIQKCSELFDYIETKIGTEKTVKFMTHFGFDNPNITSKKTLPELKALVDKILLFRGAL